MIISALDSYVLIVEDDHFFTIKIEIMLTELGYTQFKTVANVHAARLLIDRQAPTLVICDIFLEGVQTGIDLRNQLIDLKIPCILMTQHENDQLYEEAKKNSLVPYLIKPFHKLTLKSAVELLLERHTHSLTNRTLLIRTNQNKQELVSFAEILWIETETNYCYIYTASKKYILKRSLSSLLTDLDTRFIRVHNCYAINRMHVISLTPNAINIGSIAIPVSRTYRQELIRQIKTDNTLSYRLL